MLWSPATDLQLHQQATAAVPRLSSQARDVAQFEMLRHSAHTQRGLLVPMLDLAMALPCTCGVNDEQPQQVSSPIGGGLPQN